MEEQDHTLALDDDAAEEVAQELRMDARRRAVQYVWIVPLFIGRLVNGEIHPVSTDDAPFVRWRSTEISDDRFVWLGEHC